MLINFCEDGLRQQVIQYLRSYQYDKALALLQNISGFIK
jgi:hypothetical protein